jgi:signal transduction histidine kinase
MEIVQELSSTEVWSKLGRHLAHELNNPISAISTAAYLVEDLLGSTDPAEIKPFVTSIREDCSKLKSVVEEFARFVSTQSLIRLPIDFSSFAKARCEEAMKLHGVKVACDIEPTPTIEADLGLLQQGLQLLFKDAVADGSSEIHFRVFDRDGEVVLQLDDDRTTLPEAGKEDDALSAVPTQRVRGLGLELPLVKRIAELHSGKLTRKLGGRGLITEFSIK